MTDSASVVAPNAPRAVPLGTNHHRYRIHHGARPPARANSSGDPARAAFSGRSRPANTGSPSLTWAVSIFLVLQVGSGAYFIGQDGMVDVLRVAALLVLAPFAWLPKEAASRICAAGEFLRSRDREMFRRLLVGYLLWSLSATLPHGQIGQFIPHLVGAIVLLIVVRTLTSDGGTVVARVLPPLLGLTVAASVSLGLVLPDEAIVQGRLRGLQWNANLLAFYAFLGLIAGLLLVRGRIWSLVLCVGSLVAIIWSGSRASAIAAILAVLLLALSGHRRSRLWLWVVLLFAGAWMIGLVAPSASLSLRDLDTRDGSFDEAVRVWNVSPFFGVGVGGELVEVASSPLRAFVQGGIFSLIGVVVMYVVLLREAIRRHSFLFAMCVAAVVHSFAEGWFLASLGPMMLVFVAAWVGVSARYARPQTLSGYGMGERRRGAMTERIGRLGV